MLRVRVFSVRRRKPLPSGAAVQISSDPLRLERNARVRPSGEKDGWISSRVDFAMATGLSRLGRSARQSVAREFVEFPKTSSALPEESARETATVSQSSPPSALGTAPERAGNRHRLLKSDVSREHTTRS